VKQLTEEVLAARRLPSAEIARAIRRDAGVSQLRLAIELGCTRSTVARWELGLRRPRGEMCRRYADVLQELQREVLER
jgi:transcriptional regulator with XRE-family HTH domain